MTAKLMPWWFVAGILLAHGAQAESRNVPPAAETAVAGPGSQVRMSCAELASQVIPNTRITLVRLNGASSDAPEHCEIIGAINERVSAVNQQHYAIRFHLRMPATAWNGRFLFMAQGGNDGNLGNALGQGGMANPVTLGYATVSTDAGHDGRGNSVDGDGEFDNFGLDPQARIDYGYNADDQVTRKAKVIVRLFYGKDPAYSYLAGCSNGGRHAMVDATRFPDYFDGILAGDPGFNLPKAALAEAWDTQAYATISRKTDLKGNPALWTAFSPADLDLLADAIRKHCDRLDGLADGMIFNFRACKFDPALVECRSGETAACLSPSQVAALRKVFSGPKNSKGDALYASWPWDVGVAAPGWRSWKLGNGAYGVNDGATVQRGALSLPYVFVSPPARGPDYLGYLLHFDFDIDAPKIFATAGIYTVSSMEFMAASTNMTPFIRRGGKMIIYHGVSDPVFSINDTIAWYDAVAKISGGVKKIQKSVRLYAIPGMNHCGGGPAASRFDGLGALVNWVEKGQAPDRILATVVAERPQANRAGPGRIASLGDEPAAGPIAPPPVSPTTGNLVPVGRTRPLCPYPRFARYTGHGSIENEENFACR